MRRWRWGLAGAACALVLALVVWQVGVRGGHAVSAEATPPPPSVPLVTVRVGDVQETVTVQGRVGPPAGSDAKLAFPESGTLARLNVRVGERVLAGTAIAELDRAALGAALDQARADAAAAASGYGGGSIPSAALASTQAKLAAAAERLHTLERGGEAAQSDRIAAASALRQASVKVASDEQALARAQTLFAGGVLAAKDVDAARAALVADRADERAARARVAATAATGRATLEQARADFEQARSDARAAAGQTGVLGAQASSAAARLEAAQIAYDNGVLRAPNDGYVLALLKHVGESIDASTPAVDFGPRADGEASFSVPADRARRVAVGDVVLFRDADARVRGRGRITAVAPAVDAATQETTVIASGAPAGSIAGDSLTATIVVRRVRGLVVPETAVVADPETGKNVVFERKTDGASAFTAREVTLGPTDGSNVQILSGLEHGARVASQGGYELLAPSGN